jgi:hypothetical protein
MATSGTSWITLRINYNGIVVIQPPRDANRALTLALIESFLRQKDIVDQLAGRLVIVEAGRIRCRPPI